MKVALLTFPQFQTFKRTGTLPEGVHVYDCRADNLGARIPKDPAEEKKFNEAFLTGMLNGELLSPCEVPESTVTAHDGNGYQQGKRFSPLNFSVTPIKPEFPSNAMASEIAEKAMAEELSSNLKSAGISGPSKIDASPEAILDMCTKAKDVARRVFTVNDQAMLESVMEDMIAQSIKTPMTAAGALETRRITLDTLTRVFLLGLGTAFAEVLAGHVKLTPTLDLEAAGVDVIR